jgi:hypothetical protein
MIESLPYYVPVVFILITIITALRFFKAADNSKPTIVVLAVWLLIQGLLSFAGFYLETDTTPPRFLFVIGPPLILIIILFLTEKGRAYVDKLDLESITYLHSIRIPVEIVLYWLYMSDQVPELMTFEGRNFDILSGISAPVIAYLCFKDKFPKYKLLLAWNIICLCLLFNIVINGLLSAPLPIQQFAFDQPNVALLYFPFVWLPCCVVPIVLLSHLAAIRKIIKELRR